MSDRTATGNDGGTGQRRGFTPPKGRPTRRRDAHSGRRSMTTLQWFLLVLALVVIIVIVVSIVGVDTGNDVPTVGAALSGLLAPSVSTG